MNIQPISYNNVSMQAGFGNNPKKSGFLSRCKQEVLDLFGHMTFKDDPKKIDSLIERNKKMSHPAINRGIMGATAIVLQPPIDYFNPSVDKETRKISVCRTFAKIIAGTSVGMLVRGLSYKLIEKLTDFSSNSEYSKKLIPKKLLKKFAGDQVLLSNHRTALSYGLAFIAMCFTNFLIDAPLTLFLTNKFKNQVEKLAKQNAEVKYE